MIKSKILRVFHIGLLLTALASPLHAADIVWTGTTDNVWSTETNWDGGVAPGATDIAVFNAVGALNLDTVLGASRIIDGIRFNADATSPVMVGGLTQVSSVLTLDGGAATDILVEAGSHTISGSGATTGTAELDVLGNHVWNIAEGATLNINARIVRSSGSTNQQINKTGAGTLILSGTNGGTGGWNFTGGTGLFTVSEGMLVFMVNQASGNSSNKFTVLSGATLQLSGTASYNSNNGNLTLNGSGVNGLGALYVTSGTRTYSNGTTNPSASLILNTNSTIGVAEGSNFTINQDITGGGMLTKSGLGTLTLGDANNVYTGGTTILEGLLNVTAATALGSGSVTVQGGDLSPGGVIAGSIALGAGADFIMTSGTLTLTLGGVFDTIVGSGGAFSLTGGTIALTDVAAGDYAIFTGFSGGTVSGLTFSGLDEGFSASLGTDGVLTVVPEPSVYLYSGVAALFLGVVALRRRRGAGYERQA